MHDTIGKFILFTTLFAVFVALALFIISPMMALAEADVSTVNFQGPVSSTFHNFCTGEDITMSGTFHVVAQTVVNRNRKHTTITSNFSDVSGMSSSGATYRQTATGKAVVNGDLDSPQMTSANYDTRLVGPGPDNNLTVTGRTHFTRNANGELTAAFEVLQIECR